MAALRLVLIAGETSGDHLGANLVQALSEREPLLELAGIGGPRLRQLGLQGWWTTEELTAFGLVEVLRHLPRLLRLRKQLLRKIIAWQPDLVITIDAPDFNLPLGRRLRSHGIKVVHYVCPSVWAWRQGRVSTLRQAADMTLCLLPFEAQFLHQHQVPARFTGHPLRTQMQAFMQQPEQQPQAIREQLQLHPTVPVVALLPGSRSSEIRTLWPLFLRAASQLPAAVQLLTCAINPQQLVWMQAQQRLLLPQAHMHWLDPQQHGSWRALLAADAAMLCSGTVTLEAMLVATPMLVAYRMHALSWFLLKHLRLYKAKYVSLPNLLASRLLVPELLQGAANASTLTTTCTELLSAHGASMREQLQDLNHQWQSQADDNTDAAGVVLELLGRGAN